MLATAHSLYNKPNKGTRQFQVYTPMWLSITQQWRHLPSATGFLSTVSHTGGCLYEGCRVAWKYVIVANDDYATVATQAKDILLPPKLKLTTIGLKRQRRLWERFG